MLRVLPLLSFYLEQLLDSLFPPLLPRRTFYFSDEGFDLVLNRRAFPEIVELEDSIEPPLPISRRGGVVMVGYRAL